MPILRHVYDSATGAYHDVEVTQEVYDFYRRNAWAIRRNNARFYAHEIQFSSLIGGEHDAFECFNEFLSDASEPLTLLCRESDREQLVEAFWNLSSANRHLIYFLMVEGYSERRYGQLMELAQKTVHNRKKSALRRLREIIAARSLGLF